MLKTVEKNTLIYYAKLEFVTKFYRIITLKNP